MPIPDETDVPPPFIIQEKQKPVKEKGGGESSGGEEKRFAPQLCLTGRKKLNFIISRTRQTDDKRFAAADELRIV